MACVIFVHGLGSSKGSERNVSIAAHLLDVGIAALLFDLSGHGESSEDPRGQGAFVDDLQAVYQWVATQPQLDPARIGISGSSLGAVVAVEALQRGAVQPATMVLRGPPLARDEWQAINVPSLVVIGSHDPLAANVRADAVSCPLVTLSVVEGAGHLFEEPGALQAALSHTVEWFQSHLAPEDDPPAAAAPGHATRIVGAYDALFRDRRDAGRQLGERLADTYSGKNVLVLGIPRGGVPVADEVARCLDAELDVVVARKLGAPGYPELAIGAVTANGGCFLNEDVIGELGVTKAFLEAVTREQREEARRREERFRAGRPAGGFSGRIVIIVDDGLATGATMRASVRSVRAGHPAKTVVAVPVGSQQACAALRSEADEVVCLSEPEPFWAVGFYYEQFGQTEDAEVQQILADAHVRRPVSGQVKS
jgi:predicted phosphoribosyltransferase/alpha/beta superfamily hydrolase